MLRIPRDLEPYRRPHWLSGEHGDLHNGCFCIPSRGLRIMVSDGEGWDHVSVSCKDRCPTWEEMEWVKRTFFEDTDTAMQLHVPVAEHRNCHPYCLHLWRPHAQAIPCPPGIFVAP